MFLYLSLSGDPDWQAAVIPPLVHKLCLVVWLLLRCRGVEPHVVYHTMILNIFTWWINDNASIGMSSVRVRGSSG